MAARSPRPAASRSADPTTDPQRRVALLRPSRPVRGGAHPIQANLPRGKRPRPDYLSASVIVEVVRPMPFLATVAGGEVPFDLGHRNGLRRPSRSRTPTPVAVAIREHFFETRVSEGTPAPE